MHTEAGLGTVKDSPLHLIVTVEGHLPGVFADNDILEACTGGEKVVGPSDTFPHGQDIEIIAKEVEVDVRLDKRVGVVQGNLTLRQGAQEVDNNGHVVAGLRKRVVPLERAAEEADKVKLEMGLTGRAKGVKTAVSSLRGTVLFVLLEALVNSREANKFQEARADRSGLVLVVLSNGGVVLGARAVNVIVEAIAILHLQDERNNRVVKKVLADVGRLDLDRNLVLLELVLGANSAQHQQLGGLKDTLGEDDFAGSVNAKLVSGSRVDDRHADTCVGGRVDDEFLGLDSVKDSHIGLSLDIQEAALALPVMNSVHAVGKAPHLAAVDILGQVLALGNPGFGESITEALHLRNKVGMGNLDGAAGTDLLQVIRVQLLFVVVRGAFAQIVNAAIPGPVRSSKLFPVIKCWLGARNPGIIVRAGAATEDLAASVGLLDTLVVVPLNHGSLVSPVMLATSEVEGVGRRENLRELVGVGGTGFDDQDVNLRVLREPAGDSITSSATTNHDEIVGVTVGDESHDSCLL